MPSPSRPRSRHAASTAATAQPAGARPSRPTRPSRRVPLLSFLTVLSTSIAAWALLERRAPPPPPPLPPSVSGAPAETLSGPWGTLEIAGIVLDPRPDYLRPAMCDADPPVWRLPGRKAAEAARLLDAAGLPSATRTALGRVTSCTPAGCEVRPQLQLVTGLGPAERARLYEGLGQFEENTAQAQPMRRPRGELAARFRSMGASAATVTRLEGLLYPAGPGEAFADMAVLCAGAADDAERRLILAAVVREEGLLATLRVPEGADVGALSRYWGAGRRGKDVAAVIESLAKAPGGGRVDVMHLLPRFARARVNTFPEPDDAPYDCAHAALSFFSRDGDDRFLRPGEVKRAIEADYHPIDGKDLRLGDVLVFTRPDGTLIHAVAQVAGDLVFSKNGIAFHKPWQLARRSQLEAAYGNPSIYAYRRNDLGP